MPEIVKAITDQDYEAAALLFTEYAEWLNIDLCFQHFDEELVNLKEMYAAPYGAIMLCKKNTEYVACVAIRKINPAVAELKRMYVKPDARNQQTGSLLLREALTLAREYGYKKIRLDTLNTMLPAIRLYKENGFYEIPPYYYNPQETAVFFEKEL